MKTPRWFLWFTLGYAIYNIIIGAVYIIFPAFRDFSDINAATLNVTLFCFVVIVSAFNFVMFVYFLIKKCDKHGLLISGLQVFDLIFTFIGSLILQVILKNNPNAGLISSNILGAIIPTAMLIYASYLLLRKK